MSENGSGGPTAAAAADDNKGPSGFLTEIIGAPITVKLNSGVEYRGLHNDISPTVFGEAPLTDVFSFFFSNRGTTVSGWIHEHCFGEDGGVCWGAVET